jgi:hypothetical protein
MYRYPECHCAMCRLLSIVILNGIMVSSVMLSVDNTMVLSITTLTIKFGYPECRYAE